MATHASIFVWRIPWTEKPGGLQSTGSQRVWHDRTLTLTFQCICTLPGHLAHSPTVSTHPFYTSAPLFLHWKHLKLYKQDLNLFALYFKTVKILQIRVKSFSATIPSSNLVLSFLLLLLLSHFNRVWLCATPETAAHQTPPSLGFSRQEHWSGLPFPSPTHESEKWKWSRSLVSDS